MGRDLSHRGVTRAANKRGGQRVAHTDSIKNIPIFEGLEDSAQASIAECLTVERHEPGALIFSAESPGDALYIVVEGLVKVSLRGESGQEVILDTLGKGDFFGEMSLLDGALRSANVVCLSQVELLRLSRDDFRQVVGAEATIAVHVMERLSQRLRQADESISSLSAMPTAVSPQIGAASPGLDERRIKLVGRFIEEGIPFNTFLGVQVEALRPGYAVLRIPFREVFIGDPFRPAMHGGVISMLCDTTGGAACFALLEKASDRVSTIDLRIDYLRPGPAEDVLCEARVVRMGNRVAQVLMSVFPSHLPAPDQAAERANPIATAHGVYNVVRRRDKRE